MTKPKTLTTEQLRTATGGLTNWQIITDAFRIEFGKPPKHIK